MEFTSAYSNGGIGCGWISQSAFPKAYLMSVTRTPPSVATASLIANDTDPFLFRRVRTWWLLAALFLMGQENGIFSVATMGYKGLKTEGDIYASSTSLLLLTIALWTICAVLMWGYFGRILHTMRQQKAVTAFMALAFGSIVWSQSPSLTFRKAVLLLLLFAFAWFFALYYTPKDQMRLLFVAGVLLGVSSIAMALLLPRYGLDVAGGWKGVFGQKNHLGQAMLYSFSGLAVAPISGSRQLLKTVLKASIPIGLIVMSQSKGSLLLVMVLVAVRLLGPIFRRSRREQLPFFLYLLLFGSAAIVLGRGVFLSLLGRDSTLTGRTREWAVLIPMALTHPLLGYGFQAFWTGTGDSLQAMRSVGASMHGADSGYIDTLLQFGLLGIALWLVACLVSFRQFVRLLRMPSVPLAGYWYFGLLLITFIGSYTEYLFPRPGGLPTFMFVVAFASLAQIVIADRRQSTFASRSAQN